MMKLSKDYENLGIKKVYDSYGIVFKHKEKNDYIAITINKMLWYNLNKEYEKLTEEEKLYVDYNYMENSYYEIEKDLFFRVVIDLEDKYIGYVYEGEDLVTECKSKKVEKTTNAMFIIEDIDSLKQLKIKPKEFNGEEIKEILEYEEDYKILKHINPTLVFDVDGRVVFKKEKYEEIDKDMNKDIVLSFEKYELGEKYKLIDLMNNYMRSGSSIDLFIQVFTPYLSLPSKDENDSEIIYLAEEEIKEKIFR